VLENSLAFPMQYATPNEKICPSFSRFSLASNANANGNGNGSGNGSGIGIGIGIGTVTGTQHTGPGVTLMCVVPQPAAGRGKRNNYFSVPQGNIKTKKKWKKKMGNGIIRPAVTTTTTTTTAVIKNCIENEKKTDNMKRPLSSGLWAYEFNWRLS